MIQTFVGKIQFENTANVGLQPALSGSKLVLNRRTQNILVGFGAALDKLDKLDQVSLLQHFTNMAFETLARRIAKNKGVNS